MAIDGRNEENPSPTRVYKRLKVLLALAVAETILGALVLIVGMVVVIMTVQFSNNVNGAVSQIIGVVCGGIGVAAFRSVGQRQKGLITTYFFMCITATVTHFGQLFALLSFRVSLENKIFQHEHAKNFFEQEQLS